MGRRGFHGVGICLAAAGLLTFLINAVLTPLLPSDGGAAAAASTIFVLRQALSAAAAILLAIAAAGYMLRPVASGHGGRRWAACLAFLGSAALFAQEWGEVFIVHPLAKDQPLAFVALENAPGIGLTDAGAIAAFCLFAIGWIALAISILRTGHGHRIGPWLVIAGFFAIPLFSGLMGPIVGTALGSAVLGAGWAKLGLDERF